MNRCIECHSCSGVLSNMDVIPRILGWQKRVWLENVPAACTSAECGIVSSHITLAWFSFLTSDIKIIRMRWLSVAREEPPSYQRQTTPTWSKLIFYQRPISAQSIGQHKPFPLSQKLLSAGRQSCGQRLSSSVAFLGQGFLFDSGSSWVKTCKSRSTSLQLASLFKLKTRKPQGLNFCHCSHALLWGTLTLVLSLSLSHRHTHTHTHTHTPISSEKLKLMQCFYNVLDKRWQSCACVCVCLCVHMCVL